MVHMPKYKKELNDIQDLENMSKEERSLQLIKNNQRLVFNIVKGYSGDEDLFQEGNVGLIKAANTYDTSKNIKFSTYADQCIRNEIFMCLRKQKKLVLETIHLEDIIKINSDSEKLRLEALIGTEDDILSRLEYKEEVKCLLNEIEKLNPKERYIVTRLYGVFGTPKHTQAEIAEELNLSQSYVSRLNKRAIRKMRNNLKHII